MVTHFGCTDLRHGEIGPRRPSGTVLRTVGDPFLLGVPDRREEGVWGRGGYGGGGGPAEGPT